MSNDFRAMGLKRIRMKGVSKKAEASLRFALKDLLDDPRESGLGCGWSGCNDVGVYWHKYNEEYECEAHARLPRGRRAERRSGLPANFGLLENGRQLFAESKVVEQRDCYWQSPAVVTADTPRRMVLAKLLGRTDPSCFPKLNTLDDECPPEDEHDAWFEKEDIDWGDWLKSERAKDDRLKPAKALRKRK